MIIYKKGCTGAQPFSVICPAGAGCYKLSGVIRPGLVEGDPDLMLEAAAEAVVAVVFTPFVGDGGALDGEIRGAVRVKFLKALLFRFRQLLQGVGPETVQGGDLIQGGQVRDPGGGNIQVYHFPAVGQGGEV